VVGVGRYCALDDQPGKEVRLTSDEPATSTIIRAQGRIALKGGRCMKGDMKKLLVIVVGVCSFIFGVSLGRYKANQPIRTICPCPQQTQADVERDERDKMIWDECQERNRLKEFNKPRFLPVNP